jgi:hypothetical protein
MAMQRWVDSDHVHPRRRPEQVVAEAREAGAMGLKLYAQLDSMSVRRLTEAAHRAGMPVWGHAWVQPRERDGAGPPPGWTAWSTPPARGRAVQRRGPGHPGPDGDLQVATARAGHARGGARSAGAGALDTMVAHGTMFEPTLDAVRKSVASYDSRMRHIPSVQEDYARAAAGSGVEVTARRPSGRADQRRQRSRGLRPGRGPRLALRRAAAAGGFDRPHADRARCCAATRDAARAIGGDVGRQIGTIEVGHYADLVLLPRTRWRASTTWIRWSW